jgi:hypothetical protein
VNWPQSTASCSGLISSVRGSSRSGGYHKRRSGDQRRLTPRHTPRLFRLSAALSQTMTRRPESRYGRDFNKTASTRLKRVVLIPMPKARITTTSSATPRFFRNVRKLAPNSRHRSLIILLSLGAGSAIPFPFFCKPKMQESKGNSLISRICDFPVPDRSVPIVNSPLQSLRSSF